MLHQPNMNYPAIKPGPLTAADFEPKPAEAATDIGADDVTLPGDGSQRRLGHAITFGCALLSIACAAFGYWLKS